MKYHIDKNGKPAVCKATKRPCPLGGSDVHFDSAEDAQAYADEQNAKEFGLLSGEAKPAVSKERMSELMDKAENNHYKYTQEYYLGHRFEHDSYNEFLDSVNYKVREAFEITGRGRMTENKANKLAEKMFVTATPEKMVELTALWRPAFRTKKDFELTMKTYANSKGMQNGKLL